jgi:hypothetical protein
MVRMLSEPCGQGNPYQLRGNIHKRGWRRSERDLRSASATVACEAGDLFELLSDALLGPKML